MGCLQGRLTQCLGCFFFCPGFGKRQKRQENALIDPWAPKNAKSLRDLQIWGGSKPPSCCFHWAKGTYVFFVWGAGEGQAVIFLPMSTCRFGFEPIPFLPHLRSTLMS